MSLAREFKHPSPRAFLASISAADLNGWAVLYGLEEKERKQEDLARDAENKLTARQRRRRRR